MEQQVPSGIKQEKEAVIQGDSEPSIHRAVIYPEYDPVRERVLVRRVDWAIIPLIMIVYLFSFLDRGTCIFSASFGCR